MLLAAITVDLVSGSDFIQTESFPYKIRLNCGTMNLL